MNCFQSSGTRRPAFGQRRWPSGSASSTLEMRSGSRASMPSQRASRTVSREAPSTISSSVCRWMTASASRTDGEIEDDSGSVTTAPVISSDHRHISAWTDHRMRSAAHPDNTSGVIVQRTPLGDSRDSTSLHWSLVGLGMTIERQVFVDRANGREMSPGRAQANVVANRLICAVPRRRSRQHNRQPRVRQGVTRRLPSASSSGLPTSTVHQAPGTGPVPTLSGCTPPLVAPGDAQIGARHHLVPTGEVAE